MPGRRNVDIDSPTLSPIVQSDTVDNPGGSLRGVDLFADGTLSVVDINGTTFAATFVNVAPVFRWIVQIRRVNDTGTSILDANMVGLQ